MSLLGPEGRKQLKVVGHVGIVGIELGLSILIGLLGGQWLDGKFDTAPVLMWVGFGIGLASGARSMYRAAMSARRDLEDSDSTDQNP